MNTENENINEQIYKTAKQEQLARFRRCSAFLHFVEVDGTDYSVMSLFDRRDEQTAKDKMKYLMK